MPMDWKIDTHTVLSIGQDTLMGKTCRFQFRAEVVDLLVVKYLSTDHSLLNLVTRNSFVQSYSKLSVAFFVTVVSLSDVSVQWVLDVS